MMGTLVAKGLKIQLRLKRKYIHQYSYVLNSLNKKKTILKEAPLKEAVEWCQANDYKGWKAVKSRLCPQIKDLGTINKHLGDEL